MAEIRFDPINRHTVVIAPERSKRPKDDFTKQEKKSKLCPFCPGNEELTTKENYSNGDNLKSWTIRSFPNKYPAFASLNNSNGTGVQDVIVETDQHDINMGDFSLDHLKEVLKVYKFRFNTIKQNKKVRYILAFKNHGLLAGASLEHQHSQIIGLSFVPDEIEQRTEQLKIFYNKIGKCYYCNLVDESDFVFENESFVLVFPKDGRFSHESWIIPKNHQTHYENISDNQLSDLSEILSKQIKKINSSLHNPAFNVFINNGLYDEKNSEIYHWYIQIIPRTSFLAGFELATGIYINQVEPEIAAKQFKQNAL